MNSEKFKDIFQTILFQIFLLVTGSLVMMFLFYSIIPALVIQTKLPESFFQSAVGLPEKQKMVESLLKDYLEKPGLLEKDFFALITSDSPGLLIWNNILWLVSFILPAFFLYKKFKQPFNNLSDPLDMRVIVVGIIVGLVTVTFVSSFTRILFNLGIEIKGNEAHDLLFKNLHGNTGLLLWSIYSVGIFTGIIEETFFRGFLLTPFIKKNFPLGGLLISSIIFGSVHYTAEGSIFIPFILTFVGLIFGYSYYKSENIWISISAHITYNSTLLMMAYIFGGFQP